ncbi:DUF3107 domain-containing protein [Tessaracoccus sp. MC1865]|uniref:DUF3107 domain-containing protein n=1 Tax=Tessaracoccus sp. MC1865 TaxID=2760310 RepID=UPI001601B53F|nr:DUF3107 domain-containing protein [Tessaracoccus sp. MC1865]MBB1483346.1 DUF3107 domain-containing protein [Tessaracoccus sp. MC1865]QTO36462.1 DUF3107 domain-containing protein [Tessaracoccus sp. MC1865]
MEIKIGITDVAREVSIETTSSSDEIVQQLREAMENSGLLELTDVKGRRVVIPASRVGYIDIGSASTRTVGFGAV